jgi:hypothetical protein
MTKEQIQKAVDEWQKRLRLQHWTIAINWDKATDNTVAAMIDPIKGRYWANMYFCDDWDTIEPERMNNFIAHELVHLHLNEIYNKANEIVSNCSYELKENLKKMLRQEIELATDALSTAISKALPVIESLTEKAQEGAQ